MLDPKFSVSVEAQEGNYTKLVIEPLKQGYGHTLANALRRVLLTSLTGCAVTSIKVSGVQHQFTTLKGMSQDIIQLVMAVKSLRVGLDSGMNSATLKLEASGPGQVTAASIQAQTGVTIANPELVIADLADKATKLNMELTVERGSGYSLAEERMSDVVGVIPVDALFSPIKRVSPKISNTRVGRRTDFDKLELEIWTDGTVEAKDALDQAAAILVEHFQQIYEPLVDLDATSPSTDSLYTNDSMKLTVEELDLPTRIANALRKGGYKTVADLAQAKKSEIVKVKNLGERSVGLVENALSQKGASLSDD